MSKDIVHQIWTTPTGDTFCAWFISDWNVNSTWWEISPSYDIYWRDWDKDLKEMFPHLSDSQVEELEAALDKELNRLLNTKELL